MKLCSDCFTFRRFDGIAHCAIREIVPVQRDAETCGDFERRPVVKCDRCADLESALRKVDEIRIRMANALDFPVAKGDAAIFRARITAWALDLRAPCEAAKP